MNNQIQDLLQISAKLYELLASPPKGEDRDDYIEEIDQHLDERGSIVDELRTLGFQMDPSNKTHLLLASLDKGIRERLDQVMLQVKEDMKSIQNAKKNEKQYMNPYSSVRSMDGKYYDSKK